MERAVDPVAGTVAGEDAARAVAAVGGGGEADHVELGVGITEAGDGASPVGPIAVGGAFLARDLLTPLDQARARAAGGNLAVQRIEGFDAHEDSGKLDHPTVEAMATMPLREALRSNSAGVSVIGSMSTGPSHRS